HTPQTPISHRKVATYFLITQSFFNILSKTVQTLTLRSCMSDAFACDFFHISISIQPFEAVPAAWRRPLRPGTGATLRQTGDLSVTKAAAHLLVGDLRQPE
ncbi:hypothetical protein ACFXPA_24635, partial [Amycolatopsis sp. NPDC059090]|uniref:hypothetical protein n=1 Tax=Amycolatopsis sp. NPDC059090 TaxID=3346723 RepID=UPI00366FC2F2